MDERTGLDAWEWSGQDVKLQLIQRLPDQTRAFFLARGFERPAVETIAGHCVMQTIMRNTADEDGAPIEVDLGEWRAETADGRTPLRVRADWRDEWRRREQPRSARIAFEWALFPTEQRFTPGDWNMGMTTYPFPPGTRFDLHAVWHRDGQRERAVVEDVRCAPDVDAEQLDAD